MDSDDQLAGAKVIETGKTGVWLLHNPSTNQAAAFDRAQRDELRVRGMVPYRVATLAEQATAAIGQIRAKHTPLEQYIGMASLHDRNEVLFYRSRDACGDHSVDCVGRVVRRREMNHSVGRERDRASRGAGQLRQQRSHAPVRSVSREAARATPNRSGAARSQAVRARVGDNRWRTCEQPRHPGRLRGS